MVLVTGATGMVGGNLMWFLLQTNERVRAIRRKESNNNALRTIFEFYSSEPDSYLNRIDWVIADILDEGSLDIAFQNVSEVYHCAAVVDLGAQGELLADTNIKGTQHVVEAALAANVLYFCFVSSIAACGDQNGIEFIREDSQEIDLSKRSLYSKSKYLAEQIVWQGIKKGLPASIINPGVILGVSGTMNGSAKLFNQVKQGLLFYTYGGSGYVDVRDVVEIMLLLTQKKITGERYIIVAENCSNKDILTWMAEGFGKRAPYIPIGKKLLMTTTWIIEGVCKLCRLKPPIDRSTARTASGRKYYSSEKIISSLHFTFRPIAQSINEICLYLDKK